MSDWGITHTVAARVALADGLELEGELHLMSRPDYPPGPETPLDMLNRADPYFALSLRAGGVALVSKAQVAMVTCGDGTAPADPERLSAAKLVDLEVILQGGEEVRGSAAIEMPRPRSRALDFVNGPGDFFLLRSGDAARYLNKSFARLIRPLD